MRLIVFDTNGVVSAGIRSSGSPATLTDEWVLDGQFQIGTCPSIVLEYQVVVAHEKFRRHGFPPIWLEVMIRNSLQSPDRSIWPHRLPDPADAPFLALAGISVAWRVE